MFWTTLKNLFKKYFIAGILVTVPVFGTVWLLKSIIFWADGLFASFLPVPLQPWFLTSHRIPGVGLVLTTAFILFVGILTRVYLGKKLIELGDRLISKVPLGRAIYGTLKQIMQTAFTPGDQKFKGVCIIRYPHENSYALAFITGDSNDISPDPSRKFLRVFVPTTPNPTSGFMLIIPEEEVKRVDLSIEEASKIIISGGLLGS